MYSNEKEVGHTLLDKTLSEAGDRDSQGQSVKL